MRKMLTGPSHERQYPKPYVANYLDLFLRFGLQSISNAVQTHMLDTKTLIRTHLITLVRKNLTKGIGVSWGVSSRLNFVPPYQADALTP